MADFEDIDQMKTALAYAQGIIGTIRDPQLLLDENRGLSQPAGFSIRHLG